MSKVLVIIPTYNEAESIAGLVDELLSLDLKLDILVVDDGFDQTEKLIRERQTHEPRLFLIKRLTKGGRGSAVIEGMRFSLAKDYQYIVEMDADFSHKPEELPKLLELADPGGVVIASRYVKGSKIINWPPFRRIFSRLANTYANLILGIGIHDYTNGYRVYGRQALGKLDFSKIRSTGYSVLSEAAYELYKCGAKFIEWPTIFVNRARGASNFSLKEIKEAFWSVLRIRFQKSGFAILFLLVATILFFLLPIFQVLVKVGKTWQGVMPHYVSDSLYYYARMQEVADGHPFLGNPYFLEHRQDPAPVFFLPDWLAAVPRLLHIPWTATIIFNLLLWGSIFAILLYLLFRSLKLSPWVACLGSLVSFLSVYWLILRPVVMQTVFPFLILWYLALWQWLGEPFEKKRIAFLSVSLAAACYVYGYFWQIIPFTLLALAVVFGAKRDWQKLKALFLAGFLTLILSLPLLFYTLQEIRNPNYQDLMNRLGLMLTHLPSANAYYYGRWIFLMLLAWLLCEIWFKAEPNARRIFFIATGLGLLFAAGSNIFTGRDVELGTHIGRFIILWLSIFLICFLVAVGREWKKFRQLNFVKILVIAFLAIMAIGGVLRNIERALPFFGQNWEEARDVQAFARPLGWLEDNVSKAAVVWANDSLSNYIPIFTRHKVLFTNAGGLHLVSDEELRERYLLSRYFSNLSAEDLRREYRLYAGAGPAVLFVKQHNWQVRFCQALGRFGFGRNCGEIIDPENLPTLKEIQNLQSQYAAIRQAPKGYLQKYHVAYLFVDKKSEKLSNLQNLGVQNPVYDDGRFTIFRVAKD